MIPTKCQNILFQLKFWLLYFFKDILKYYSLEFYNLSQKPTVIRHADVYIE